MDDGVLRGWLEVAVFVEDIVGRQECLGADSHHLASVEQGRRIGERTSRANGILSHKPDDQPHITHGRSQAFQGRLIGPNEGLSQEQVAWRITGEGQFRGEHQIDLRIDAAPIGLEDQPLVGGDVPDRGVELR